MLQYPQVVQIETTTACNAHCGFCPHADMAENGRKGRMTDELLGKIFSEISSWPVKPTSICPFLTNEPCADARLLDIAEMAYAVVPAAALTLFTNASLLTPALVDKIHARHPRIEWFCSLHHTNAEAYKAELGLDFERTVANIKYLSVHSPRHITVLKVGDGNAAHSAVFCDWVSKHIPRANPMVAARWNWKGDIATHERDLHLNIKCPRRTSLTILHDGRVALCCMDQKGEYELGDINKQTLLEVYNSPRWHSFFDHNKSENFPCKNCNMR